MKLVHALKGSVLAALAVGSFQGFAHSQVSEIDAPVDALFIPEGFDSNDNVELVLSGDFSTTCFKTGPVTADVDHANKTISLKAVAYQYGQDAFCATARIPFTQTAKLGLLEEGIYSVSLVGHPELKQALHVQKNVSANPDDYLYAPVHSVFIDQKANAKRSTIEVKGVFPRLFDGCMKLVDLRVVSSRDVYVVLPIAEIFYNQDCVNVPLEFKAVAPIAPTSAQKALIHTRVTNGNSLNLIWSEGSLHHGF